MPTSIVENPQRSDQETGGAFNDVAAAAGEGGKNKKTQMFLS